MADFHRPHKKSIPYTPYPHPFIERLIGSVVLLFIMALPTIRMLNIVRLFPALLIWMAAAFIPFFNVGVVCAEGLTLEPVVIQLKWSHQFQFAGYYAAREKGYYAEAGLDVSFREYDTAEGRAAPVLNGKAQYGAGDPGLLKLRLEGKPLVVLAQIFQHSPSVLLTRRDSAILDPYSLSGKKVMMSRDDFGAISLYAMLLETIRDLDKVTIMPHSYNLDDLTAGKVDAIAAYLSNEPFRLKQLDVPVNILYPRSYGIDFYGDNLFTTEMEIRDHPERVEKVLRATLKGWQYALTHKNEAIDLIRSKYAPQLDRDQLDYEAKIIDQMIMPDLIPIGDINLGRYEGIAKTYQRLGITESGSVPHGFLYNRAGNKTDLALTAEEKAWLKAHPVITLGGGIFAPLEFFDETKGQPDGVGPDYAKLIGSILGIDFKLVSGDWPEILKMAKAKEIDGVRLIFKNSEREKYLTYTKPYVTIAHAIVTKKRTSEIHALKDLSHKKVGTLQGIYAYSFMQAHYPDIDIVTFPTWEKVLRALTNNEVEAVVGTLPVISYMIEKMFITDLKIVAVPSEMERNAYLGIRPDWPDLAAIINKAIEAITKTQHSEIKRRWVALRTTDREDRIPLTPKEQIWLAQNHIVRVSAFNFPPYTIIQESEPPEGISIDYLKEISKRTGIQFDYQANDQSFAESLENMKKRQAPDLVTTLVQTPDREAYFSFTDSYLETPLVIFARSTADFISDITGLTGKRVAVTKASVVHKLMVDSYPEIELVLFDSPELGLEALATGQVDAFIGNLTVSSHLIHRRGLADLHVVAPTPFDKYLLSMANRKDWPELTSIINKVLDEMSPEEHSAIQSKYMQIPFEAGPSTAQIIKWVLIIVVPALFIILLFFFWNRSMAKEVRNRKMAEAAARQAQDAAEAATLAKSTFLSNMSHELRTPMNAILGFARLLNRDTGLAPEYREKVSIINRSGEHLLGMVDEILSLAKIESGRVELALAPFDVVQTLKDIGQMVMSRAEAKGLRFSLELDANLSPCLQGDVGKIRQILINLLGNAVKFTSEGSVCLRARSQPMADDPAKVMLQFEVEDSGPGIPREQLDRIFDSFVQGEDNGDNALGVGLGLAISKSLVDTLAGEIEVKSEPGKGSLFALKIPLEPADVSLLAVQQEVARQVIGLKPEQADWRILVVDDNRENRALLTSMLGQVGFVTQEAENGEAAIQLFRRWHPHLIMMDMRMPVMDGYAATGKIRELPEGDEVKIVAVTAHAFDEHRGEILATGCDELVRKPFHEHEILDAIARHLEVEYLYADVTDAPLPEETTLLTEGMLSELPEELLSELREASLALNRDSISAIIDRIEAEAPDTARALQQLMDNFQMGRIHDLLKSIH